MANYIGFLVDREVSYDPTKYEEYAAAAVKFIRGWAALTRCSSK